MPRTSPIPAPPQAYRACELLAAGVSPKRLRAQDIRRLGRGIVLHPRCPLDPEVYRDRCLIVGQSLKPEFFLSHRSAALLYRMPTPRPPGRRVDVASFAPLRAPRRPEVIAHRVRGGTLEWAAAEGLTLPSPPDVWCQLSAILDLKQLVAAGDFLISGALIPNSGGRRRPPLATFDALLRAHGRHRGTRGSPLRARALPLLRRPVDSPQESLLRLTIVDAGFEEPRVGCPVPFGDRVLHADLGYPQLRIAIDYEGVHHFEDPQQARLDEDRRRHFVAAGWTWIRVTAEDLRDPRRFIAELSDVMAEAYAAL